MIELKHETKLKTPELDKISAVHDKSMAMGDFIEWLKHSRDPPLYLCIYDEDAEAFFDPMINTEKLLAEYFKIDLNKVEKERQELLEFIRSSNNK